MYIGAAVHDVRFEGVLIFYQVISCNSLEWAYFGKGGLADVFLGTAFDLAVHVLYAYHLLQYLTVWGCLLSLALAALGARAILFNDNFAWRSPSDVPNWVKKRLQPL